MKLLIVDDQPTNRKLLRAQVEAEGHAVLEAADGVDALRVLEGEPVDAIISDILMPNMDGFRLCLEIRKKDKFAGVPFILYTSTYDSPQDRQLAQSIGADHYIVKPAPTSVILEAVREAVQKLRGTTHPAASEHDETYVLKQYSEALVRKLEEKNIELNETLKNLQTAHDKVSRLSRIYAVLSEINSAIVRIHDRQRLFEEACRIAVEYGRFHMAWLGFVDAEALKIKPAAWAGDTEGFFDVARMLLNKAGKDRRGLIWDAYCEKRPVTSNDVQNDPRVLLAEYYKKRGIHSVGIFPLMLDNEVSGMLGFYSKEPDIFDEEEIKLLTELANDISFGLQYITKDEKLNYLAYYDSLTGLPNRTLFLDRLTQALHAAKQTQTKVAVLVGDVQHFRQINETFGRQAGDMLLRELAERIRSLAPDPDNVARIGADVFAAIISDVKTPTDVARLFEDVFTKIYNMKFILTGKELSIKMVAGAAIFPNDGEDADVLCRNAEAAQKKAKLTGDRYLFYQPEMTARIAETLLLENKLRKAIELDQFVLHYQPKVHVETHKVTGLEALIRWNDPESGLVPPMKFIPILEESGMILEVGFWVIRRAFADARRWRAEGIQPPRIAVNVSQVQMQQKDFVADVRRAIAEYGSEPLMLDLEITETMLMRDIDENIEKLSTVRKMGIVIAIDDFGTGYSSLGYLARLPVNALKIDRSFIARMTSSPESMTIVSTIISLAHSMNLKVIAEGVETDEQSKFLRLLKCDELQGYLFSKPLPPDKVVDLLRVG